MPADVHHEEESSDATEIDLGRDAGLDLSPRTAGVSGATRRGGGWFAVAVLVAIAIGGFLVVRNLGSATLFFYNADEAVAQRATLGTDRFKLQGTVACKSVVATDEGVAFDVSFRGVTVPVVHRGDPPQLFQQGIPVVLEGAFTGPDGRYESDRIFVKHTEEYVEDNGERLTEAGSPDAPGYGQAAEGEPTVGQGLTGVDLCGST